MKFRIIEKKLPFSNPGFIPQYKKLLFWYNISNSVFYDTIYRHTELDEMGSTYSMYSAKKSIKEFKYWLKSRERYTIIHNVE